MGATALVDGCNLLGPVVGAFCMELAISKAKELGVGIVVAKHSTHYGMAGFYSTMALKHNLIVSLSASLWSVLLNSCIS